MCWPLAVMAPYIMAGVSAAATGYGAIKSSQAASTQANAISSQNAATSLAQNQAFSARLAASQDQSNSQFATSQREMAARTTQALATRAAQSSALDRTSQTLAGENQTADQLRAAGDQRAQELLQATTAPVMDQSQQGAQDKAAALLAASQQNGPTGPAATDPSGSGASTSTSDPMTKVAMARRLGIAASNIRQYGADIARVASYGQPLADTGQAIMANRTGIMPAQTADQLLRSGAGVRLLPSQIAYSNATNYGAAADTKIQSDADAERSYAGLKYSNATGTANLAQSDLDTQAANRTKQATADAAWSQQLGGLFSGLGNLGAYGAGLYGPNVYGKPTVPGGTSALT